MNAYEVVFSTDEMSRDDAARAWAVMQGNGVVSWHHTRADALFWAKEFEADDRASVAVPGGEIDCDF